MNYDDIPDMIHGEISTASHNMAVWLVTNGGHATGNRYTSIRPGCFLVRDADKPAPDQRAELVGIYTPGVRYPDLEADLHAALSEWSAAA